MEEDRTVIYIGKETMALAKFVEKAEKAGFIINLDYELKPIFSYSTIVSKLKERGEKSDTYKVKRISRRNLVAVPCCDLMNDFIKHLADCEGR